MSSSNKTVAKKIVERILDEGLANSTFRDNHPDAYLELTKYRVDLEADVVAILNRFRKRLAVKRVK